MKKKFWLMSVVRPLSVLHIMQMLTMILLFFPLFQSWSKCTLSHIYSGSYGNQPSFFQRIHSHCAEGRKGGHCIRRLCWTVPGERPECLGHLHEMTCVVILSIPTRVRPYFFDTTHLLSSQLFMIFSFSVLMCSLDVFLCFLNCIGIG